MKRGFCEPLLALNMIKWYSEFGTFSALFLKWIFRIRSHSFVEKHFISKSLWDNSSSHSHHFVSDMSIWASEILSLSENHYPWINCVDNCEFIDTVNWVTVELQISVTIKIIDIRWWVNSINELTIINTIDPWIVIFG